MVWKNYSVIRPLVYIKNICKLKKFSFQNISNLARRLHYMNKYLFFILMIIYYGNSIEELTWPVFSNQFRLKLKSFINLQVSIRRIKLYRISVTGHYAVNNGLIPVATFIVLNVFYYIGKILVISQRW